MAISGDLRQVWEARIGRPASDEWALRAGSPLTAPVIVGDRAYVAETEAHRLLALDTERGSVLWEFTAGGRITTPPTVWNGLCLFGAHDGWVYCLRADDGELVWRFLAAPTHRRIVAYGQLESAWPTAGAVLIHDSVAYVAAGRAPDADGGIFVHALQPETGELIWTSQPGLEVNGMCDYLVADASHVYLANWQFDPKTGDGRLVSGDTEHLRGGKAGLLEASWTRIEMALRKAIQDWSVAETDGQLLAFTPHTTFGYAWTKDGKERKLPGVLFAAGALKWSQTISGPSQVEALVLTRDALFAAGPQDRGDRNAGGAIWSHSAKSGERLQTAKLPAPPVYDGLAAAHGRLYVATSDGRILCYEGQ